MKQMIEKLKRDSDDFYTRMMIQKWESLEESKGSGVTRNRGYIPVVIEELQSLVLENIMFRQQVNSLQERLAQGYDYAIFATQPRVQTIKEEK